MTSSCIVATHGRLTRPPWRRRGARAECVSAPIEMKSTPVSATARTLSSVMPPEASSFARPAANSYCFCAPARSHVVEQDRVRAGGERLAALARACRTPPRPANQPSAARSTAARIAAGEPEVVVLDQNPVVEPEAVVRSASAPDRVLLDCPQPGRRLSGVEDRRAGAGDGVHVAAGQRRYARQPAEQVQRQPLATRGARARSRRAARSRPAVSMPSVASASNLRSGSSSCEDRLARARVRRRRRAPSAGSSPSAVTSSGTTASLVRSPAPRSSASQARTSTAVSSMPRRRPRGRAGGRCASR